MSALTPAGSTRPWRRLRAYVLDRDGHRCRMPLDGGEPCGAYATHVDHIKPRSLGGTDHPANLRAACIRCNLSRGARPESSPPSRTSAVRWSW